MDDDPKRRGLSPVDGEVGAKLTHSRIELKPGTVPYVSFRLRMNPKGSVHQSELDTGSGIITVCGGYTLSGRYQHTDKPVTCRRCLRSLRLSSSRSDA